MKKNLLLLTAFTASFIMVFSGCGEKKDTLVNIDPSFNCSANISCPGLDYTADISYSVDSPLIIEITSPESLAGLKTGFKDNVFKSGIGEKICQTENHYLPDSSPSQQLYNFIMYLSAKQSIEPYEEENGVYFCKGKIYSKDFTFSVNKSTGKILFYQSEDVRIDFTQ